MRKLFVTGCLAMMPASAFAWDSMVEDVKFSGSTSMFTDPLYRWESNPVDVGIADLTLLLNADVTSKLDVEMYGDSRLQGPSELKHTWKGTLGGGTLTNNTLVKASVSVVVESSLFDFAYDFYRENWPFSGSKTFNSMLLPPGAGGQVTVDLEAADLYTLEYSYEAEDEDLDGYPDWEITIGGSVIPDSAVTLKGQQITTNAVVAGQAAETVTLAKPGTNDGELDITAVWEGIALGNFDIQIAPLIEGSYGGFSLSSASLPGGGPTFDIPFFNDEDEKEVRIQKQFGQPMPALDVSIAPVNFGTLDVGQTKAVEVKIGDAGAINLTGKLKIEGEGFSIDGGQDDFVATLTRDAVVTIEFAPGIGGTYDAELVVESDDPVRGLIRIPLKGTGVASETDADGDGVGDGDLKNGCGCVSTPTQPLSAGLFAAGLVGLLVRRRKA